MQYWHRKLQRSVTDSRRFRSGRASVSRAVIASSLPQRLENVLERAPRARVLRRVAYGVAAGLRLPELHEQGHEFLGIVALEGDHEILVVHPEGIGGVDPDGREAMTGTDVLGHHPASRLDRQQIPLARLHERVDEEVLRLAR